MEASRNLLKSQHGKDPRRSHVSPTWIQVGWFWEEEELLLKALLCFCGGGQWAGSLGGGFPAFTTAHLPHPSLSLVPFCQVDPLTPVWHLSQEGFLQTKQSGNTQLLWPPREPSALSLCSPPVHSLPSGGTMWVPVLLDLASMSWGENGE